MDCILPGPSVHGILQARILEWVDIFFSRGSFQPRDWTWVSNIAGRFLPSGPPGKPNGFKSMLKKKQKHTHMHTRRSEGKWAVEFLYHNPQWTGRNNLQVRVHPSVSTTPMPSTVSAAIKHSINNCCFKEWMNIFSDFPHYLKFKVKDQLSTLTQPLINSDFKDIINKSSIDQAPGWSAAHFSM